MKYEALTLTEFNEIDFHSLKDLRESYFNNKNVNAPMSLLNASDGCDNTFLRDKDQRLTILLAVVS